MHMATYKIDCKCSVGAVTLPNSKLLFNGRFEACLDLRNILSELVATRENGTMMVGCTKIVYRLG